MGQPPQDTSSYRSFGYPWILFLYVAAVLLVLGNALVHTPKIALVNIAISLAGIPVYFIWKKLYR